MLKDLQEKWNCLQAKNPSVNEIRILFQETVETIRDQVIPSFFISEFDNIHLLYERVEKEQRCQIPSLEYPVTEMTEYQGGLREYIEQTLDKTIDTTVDINSVMSDISLVNEKSVGFVESLFSESVNPPFQITSEEGLGCLEHLISIKENCNEILESGISMGQIIDTCKNDMCRDGLAKIYFESTGRYLLEYVDRCFQVYETVSDSILKKEPVKESLQVF